MYHITKSAVHCINPDCKRPYPQPWGNKFCVSCGSLLHLLDRYVPLQPLGSGGFAQIYTVWDGKTQTEKVIKVLVENSPKALQLFTQEADVLIKLRHPGVPLVEADGYFQVNLSHPKPRVLACLVMEKINGPTLEEVLKNYPQGCPEDLVLNWFAQAVKILQELHKRHIIHRDIKPSNLMLRNSATGGENKLDLVLIDFGGVKQFNNPQLRRGSSSTKLYSSGYSPPEQINGGNVSPGADFYALGRTMIELLTGEYPPDLADTHTGVLRWRSLINVNPQLADLLDEMIQEDVRSRPLNAGKIQQRLTKITRTSSQTGLFSQIKDSFHQAATQLSIKFSFLIQAVEQTLNNFTTATGKTLVLIANVILRFLQACLATIWAILLTTLGGCIGTITGYTIAYRTVLANQFAEYISRQLPELVSNPQAVMVTEMTVFMGAGLGTAWGLTISKCFGQRQQFLLTSLMGMLGYGLSWLSLQLITPQDNSEKPLVVILIAVFLLVLSVGFRSHRLVYALFAAFGTAIIFAFLILLGFPTTNIFQLSGQPFWWMIFFTLVNVLMSFWLGVTHYLIVPGLRFLGWR